MNHRLRALVRATGIAVLAVMLAGTSQPSSAAEAKPRHIVIGLDLSKSNPLVTDKEYAAKVARRVGPIISSLEPRSIVTLRTFGAYDVTVQDLSYDRVISSRHRPEDVARTVQGIIAGVPTLIEKGTLSAQMATNIVPFLENMAEVVDCKAHATEIYLITDGLEDSEYARLIEPKSTLPLPTKRIFWRCQTLEILGLGVGSKSPLVTSHLREQWTSWAKAAGFKEFHGLNDW